MHVLFLKILFVVICILALGVCLKIIFKFFGPSRYKKNRVHFKDLVAEGIYEKQIIKRALSHYIPLGFHATFHHQKEKTKSLMRALDLLLNHDTGGKFLLLLAESGAGKTSFILNYYLYNKKKPKHKQHRIILVPMASKNADRLISAAASKDCALFLDGLDEDVQAFDDPRKRLGQLLHLASGYRRVFITCHLNFLQTDRHTARRKGHEIIQAPGKQERFYELKKIYLSRLSFPGAQKIIEADLPFWKKETGKETLAYIKTHSAIGFTPLTLTYMNAVLPKNQDILSRSDLYKAIVQWCAKHNTHGEDSDQFVHFAGHLAVDLFTHRHHRGEEAVPAADLEQKPATWGAEFHPVENHPHGLLIKNQAGTVKFLHRSFMEYLFIRQLLAGNKDCFEIALSDTMKSFLFETLKNEATNDLQYEFQWLSRFKLKARGIKPARTKDKTAPPNRLFYRVLSKKPAYKFLQRLNKLLENPIFYEFGWNQLLSQDLKKAVFQSKTSVLKITEPRMAVQIDPQKIEITRQDRQRERILINQKDFEEYIGLEKNAGLTTISRYMDSAGLKRLNAINKSRHIAALPDLNTFREFTLYFTLNRSS